VKLRILYSFNKTGFEAEYWTREIAGASDEDVEFVPFNHDPYLSPRRYLRAQQLDNLYFDKDPGLTRMYADLEARLRETGARALLVDTCPPYHPDYLRKLDVFKALRIADGPLTAYDRDFAYVHAYDQILYHSPAHSRDLDLAEKLRYVGAKRADFWSHCAFDAMRDPSKTEADILAHERDIEIIFVGGLLLNKMPMLAKVKKAFGRKFVLRGACTWKRNLYWNYRYYRPSWVTPIGFEEYRPLYQRTKIGINVHNRGDYTVGGYRMFDLPANGVMQICDGGRFLGSYFEVGKEVVGYSDADDLIDKVRYYLAHDAEREAIALAGFRRVQRDYLAKDVLRRGGRLIAEAMGAGAVGAGRTAAGVA